MLDVLFSVIFLFVGLTVDGIGVVVGTVVEGVVIFCCRVTKVDGVVESFRPIGLALVL